MAKPRDSLNAHHLYKLDMMRTFVVRVALLKHRSDLAFNADKDSSLRNSNFPNASNIVPASISIGEILSPGSGTMAIKDKKSQKFPKDLIKCLESGLKAIIMRQQPGYDDALLRGSVGVFYGYYTSEAFQKSMKDNRKIEDVILMFFSKANGELHKRVPEDQVIRVTNQHVAQFIRFVIQTIKTNRLASAESELMIRLSSYESKILLKSELLPPGFSAPPSEERSAIPLVYKTPFLMQVCDIVQIAHSELQNLIDDLWYDATDTRAAQDMRLLLDEVLRPDGVLKQSMEFDTESDFTAYRDLQTQEISHLLSKALRKGSPLDTMENSIASTDINAISRSNSSSSKIIDTSSARTSISTTQNAGDLGKGNFYFIPLEPDKCYEALLVTCFDHDLYDLTQKFKTEDLSMLESILNTETSRLLSECRIRWRITEGRHSSIYLDCCESAYRNGYMELLLLELALRGLKEFQPYTVEIWTIREKDVYKQALLKLNESLFRDLYAALQTIFSGEFDALALTVLGEHIHSDVFFAELGDLTAYLFDEIQAGMESSASDAYLRIVTEVSANDDLEILHLTRTAELLIKRFDKLRKKYPKPILDAIYIWPIYGRVGFGAFLLHLQDLLDQCQHNARQHGTDLISQDMFDLYRILWQMLQRLQSISSDYVCPIDIDQMFKPSVMSWLAVVHKSLLNLVIRALEVDDFTNIEVPDGDEEVRSQSIVMIFKSFNQHYTYLEDLNWFDEYWNAKFSTILCKSISDTIREYCLATERLFWQEMAVVSKVASSDTNEVSLQQRLVAKAIEALAKKEVIDPFHIPASACVMINNMEWAKVHLDKLETRFDSSRISAIVEQQEGVKPAWEPGRSTVFTIKVVAAQDLKSSDTTGFSDSYVVLSDQKGKRIGKTRTIYTDFNPRWDESFEIQALDSIWLAATVWDRDLGGEHDIRGRCYFKLDPPFFADFQQKDFNIALDTQGSLHLRITMEGELDDSSFYFGRAFRFLNRTEGEMTRSVVDSMTPMITTTLSRQTLKSALSKPMTIDNTIDSAINLLTKAGITSNRKSDRNSAHFTSRDLEAAIDPLLQYLDNNFKVLDSSLNRSAFFLVLKQLWKCVIVTLENLVVPPLPTLAKNLKKPLREMELDTVYKWLGFMKDTFAGDGGGLSEEELQTPEYNQLLSLRFFYFDDDKSLMDEAERMASSSHGRQLLANSQYGLNRSGTRAAYNLGTIRQKREEKIAQQRETTSNEDIILRVLCLRPGDAVKHYLARKLDRRNHEAMLAISQAGMTRQIGGAPGRIRVMERST